MTELLLRAFGPRQIVAEEIARVRGVDEAYLFGSWAARYLGEQGREPLDVDVLVIGSPDRDDLDDAVQRASGRLARAVNSTVRSHTWWAEGDDGFHIEVTRRPLVPLDNSLMPGAARPTRQRPRSSPTNCDPVVSLDRTDSP